MEFNSSDPNGASVLTAHIVEIIGEKAVGSSKTKLCCEPASI
jgi:hypothetical protein